jgi:hypothetical protein
VITSVWGSASILGQVVTTRYCDAAGTAGVAKFAQEHMPSLRNAEEEEKEEEGEGAKEEESLGNFAEPSRSLPSS